MASKRRSKKAFYSYFFSKYGYKYVIVGIITVLIAGMLLWYFLISSRGVYSEGDIVIKEDVRINLPVTASPPNNVTVSDNVTFAAMKYLEHISTWLIPIYILIFIVGTFLKALDKKND